MDEYYVPRYLDEPFKIAFLTVDELVSLIGSILLGLFMFNAPMVGLIIGTVIVSLLKKLKGEEGHYYLFHLAYWYFPPIIKLKSTPPSHVREILG